LKGANVIVTPEGRAKVLDFVWRSGRSRDREEPTRTLEPITEAGSVAGTLCYMAPEVFVGSRPMLAGDLWALGDDAVRGVTGTCRFAGDGIRDHLSDPGGIPRRRCRRMFRRVSPRLFSGCWRRQPESDTAGR